MKIKVVKNIIKKYFLKFKKLADLLCRFPLTTFSKKNSKKILKIFREIFFSKFFWAITVPHLIWSMPAKIWGV
jgi:hypothetical protein